MSIQIYDYEELEIMVRGPQNLSQNAKNYNRLYLSWKNSSGVQCKMIGPQTKCFCNHRFKQHEYLNPMNGKTHCISKGCKCKTFQYIPTHGAYDFKCLCKHSFKEHDRNNKMCQRQKCSECKSFASAWTCSCGQKYQKHHTVSQTFQQRKKQNKSMNDLSRMANELESNIKQGSLYKPIKMDKQSKKRRQSDMMARRQSIAATVTLKNIEIIERNNDDEIQEIDFKFNSHCQLS